MRRPALLLIPMLTSLCLAACGDDDTETDAARAYCDAVDAANAHGEELFEGVDEDDEVALLAAERGMIDFVLATFPEAADLPEEMRDDYASFLEGLEGQAEPGFEPTAEQQEAEERLLAWEEEHCATS